MKSFQLLIKPVSYDCNLRCKYCFYLRVEELYKDEPKPRMKYEVLERLISNYLKFNFRESIFGWQGGEPTLAGLDFFKSVIELQQQHGSSGQLIGNALQTNGILINDEWASFLDKYKFLVGLSLDGPKQIHDRYRKTKSGKSVWKKVMAAANCLRRHNVEFNILCVISKANVNQVETLFNFFLEHGFYYLQFIPALESDNEGNRASFSISPAQYGKFLCELFNLWSKEPMSASIRTFDGIISHLMGYSKGICSLEEQCADYLLIEWNGDAYPCDFFAHDSYRLGNIMVDSLSKLKNERDVGFVSKKGALSEECRACKWLDFCFGGCIKDRVFAGNPNPEKTYFCSSYKSLFSHSIDRFKEICSQIKMR